MQQIQIAGEPNQSFSVNLEGIRWDISIKVAKSTMTATVSADGVVLIHSVRLAAYQPIIPYQYLQGDGNFAIITNHDEIPWWEEFGESQFLIYATKQEIDGIPDLPDNFFGDVTQMIGTYSNGQPAYDLYEDAAIYGEASTIEAIELLTNIITVQMPNNSWSA